MKQTTLKILAALLVLVMGIGGVFALNEALGWRGSPDPGPLIPLGNGHPADSQNPAGPIVTELFFGGDIMLAREVDRRIRLAQDPALPYRSIRAAVRAADLSFANLESPFSDLPPISDRELVFRADPVSISGLKDAGFDVLSAVNNHAFDQETYGVEYTHRLLTDNGISPVGTGLNCHQGVTREVNGIRFGYLAYSYGAYNDGGAKTSPLACSWKDTEQMTADIRDMRQRADLVIVSAHMGVEYEREPQPADVTRARAAVDAGADLVVGHHPHWIQAVEEYGNGYIFYSLGNLVFDQMWSEDTRQGLTVRVLLENKNISRITLAPVIIENYCCPRFATDTETKTILRKIDLTDAILSDKN